MLRFLESETSAGLALMGAAALALILANSPLAASYFWFVHLHLGPLSLTHWVNDAAMALFFLAVGLEIKREMLDGHLASWSDRLLPGAAATGGMAVPALIYVAFNWGDPATLRGWAIPSATDIAFSLGVLSLMGPRVPVSLKVFLAALAVIDDLGAVLVIAIFYTNGLAFADLGAAGALTLLLVLLNRRGVGALWPYLLLGVALWVLVFRSGVHATLAGVVLAITIPLGRRPVSPGGLPEVSPLYRLQSALRLPVAFLVVPVFGFVNAGLSFAGITPATMTDPVALGIAAGLFFGKVIGVFGTVALMVRAGLATPPQGAGGRQVLGIAFLCGIGFTMSLFIGLLAFDDPQIQDKVKLGILGGSLASALAGYLVLRKPG